MRESARLLSLLTLLSSIIACGGTQGSGPLAPKGKQCPVGPPGPCALVAERSDEDRFDRLKALADALVDDSHPLSKATLAGGEEGKPIGDHIRSVGILLSQWHLEKSSGGANAARRDEGGDLHALAKRIRCATDKLVELGANAEEDELVCWCQELWKTSRAYSRMPPR